MKFCFKTSEESGGRNNLVRKVVGIYIFIARKAETNEASSTRICIKYARMRVLLTRDFLYISRRCVYIIYIFYTACHFVVIFITLWISFSKFDKIYLKFDENRALFSLIKRCSKYWDFLDQTKKTGKYNTL